MLGCCLDKMRRLSGGCGEALWGCGEAAWRVCGGCLGILSGGCGRLSGSCGETIWRVCGGRKDRQ